MTDIGALVRAARRSGALTQFELARRARVGQSRVSRCESGDEDPRFATADRLLAAAGHRLYSAPTRRDDAATAAAAIRELLHKDRPDSAFRQLIQLNDDLVAEKGLMRGILTLAEPEPTGDPVWDAAIAALVEWRLDDEGLPHPAWLAKPDRRLASSQHLRIDPADPVPSAADVPRHFDERGVLAWEDSFASV